MGLFDWIVAGAGWHLGKAAVEEAIDSAKKKLRDADEDTALTEAERAKLRREAEKVLREAEERRAAEAKERAARAKQMERDVDRELRELKKKLGK